MVPHLWIKECLDLFGVVENIKTLLVRSMDKGRVMLCAGNSKLGEADTKREPFSPSVFDSALIPLSLILRRAKAAYEFPGSREKINHFLFMDGLKLYGRNENELDLLVQTICIF